MYLPLHSRMGVWLGMKLLAVSTFRPPPRRDTLHLAADFSHRANRIYETSLRKVVLKVLPQMNIVLVEHTFI